MFSTDMLLTFATQTTFLLSLEGRFLVAKEALKVGEVIISEVPLFDGNTEAEKSRQAMGRVFWGGREFGSKKKAAGMAGGAVTNIFSRESRTKL